MQSTPYIAPRGWLLQYARNEVAKSQSSGWVFSDDPKSYRPFSFGSLEGAVEFCKDNGEVNRAGV